MPKRAAAPPVHPFDRVHGTDTSGLLSAEWLASGTKLRLTDLTAYYGIAPSILRGLLDLWIRDLHPPAIERTVFLDVGAGKGRALLVAAEYPFLRVEGVELNPALAAIAASNLATWQRHADVNPLAPVEIHCADAVRHPMPPEPVLAFLFHPFEQPVLKRFLHHAEQTLVRSPRPFDLAYVNAEHDDLLSRHPAFHRLWMGRLPMSPEDHVADLAEIANQEVYGSTGDELCALYRFVGREASASKQIRKS